MSYEDGRVFVGTETIKPVLSRMTCPLVQASVITIQIIGLILALHTERTTLRLSTVQPELLSSLFLSVKLSQLSGQTSGYQSWRTPDLGSAQCQPSGHNNVRMMSRIGGRTGRPPDRVSDQRLDVTLHRWHQLRSSPVIWCLTSRLRGNMGRSDSVWIRSTLFIPPVETPSKQIKKIKTIGWTWWTEDE